MGIRSGIVRKITVDAVFVREKMVNVVGQEEAFDTVLQLPDEKRARETATTEMQLLKDENGNKTKGSRSSSPYEEDVGANGGAFQQ
jgi:hypothetical protein